MTNLNKKLEEASQKDRQQELEWERKMREEEEKRQERRRLFNTEVQPHLRQAKPRDYKTWLEGWLEGSGEITHYYDYPLPSSFYVATSDLKLSPLYGAMSVEIIVPVGITITYENGLGHNNLYFMDGFDHAGGWVPAYSNL